jgi:oxygen-independent coproporphyrinogen-3 oxidase
VARIIEQVWSDRGMERGAEITLEANPDDVTPAAVEAWAGGRGEPDLTRGAVVRAGGAALDAPHPRRATDRRAVELIRGGGINELSLDLIFGCPVCLTGTGPPT